MPSLLDDVVAGGPLGSDGPSLAVAERGVSYAQPSTGQTPTLASSGVINPNLSTVYRFTTGGAVTGILMNKGVRHGQVCILINVSANNATFATSATSFVADGANVSVLATRMIMLVWSSPDQLWYGCESS